jgi:hypothetical protein
MLRVKLAPETEKKGVSLNQYALGKLSAGLSSFLPTVLVRRLAVLPKETSRKISLRHATKRRRGVTI